MKRVVIIGSGLGGLATALRLTTRGYQVTIVEKNNLPGGRLNMLQKDGFTFDIGPSFFSMSYEFEELARDCNLSLPFEYYRLDPLYCVNFQQGNSYLIHSNLQKLAAQFEALEPNVEQKLTRYLHSAGLFFDDTMDRIVRRNYHSIWEFLGAMLSVPPHHLPKLFRTFWDEVCKYFTSDELRQVISLVAFFLGRTPFDTPAVYTLLSYTELVHDGYFNVKGGMYQIVEGMVRELKNRNTQFVYNTEITSFEGNKSGLKSFITRDGQQFEADIFVVNADAAWFRGTIFKRKGYTVDKLDKMQWTMAPLTIYLGIKGKINGIHHHNYYLGNNFREYAGKVFTESVSLDKPYYYVNVLSQHNPECAPEGCESVFILCPVPDLRFKPNWEDADLVVENIIADLGNRINQDIRSRIISKTVFTPEDWQNKFNLHRGSGLGLAHGLTQIAALRPSNADEVFSNVFYCGASTVPGTGLPMAIISSKLVTQRIHKRYGTV